MLERDIEKHLVEKVKEVGGEVRKVQWINRRGAPDRLIMLPGAIVWVELKAPGKKPEDHQAREHDRLEWAGQTVLVIDSKRQIDRLVDLWYYMLVR